MLITLHTRILSISFLLQFCSYVLVSARLAQSRIHKTTVKIRGPYKAAAACRSNLHIKTLAKNPRNRKPHQAHTCTHTSHHPWSQYTTEPTIPAASTETQHHHRTLQAGTAGEHLGFGMALKWTLFPVSLRRPL